MSPEPQDPNDTPTDELRIELGGRRRTTPTWRRGRRTGVAVGAGLIVVVGLAAALTLGEQREAPPRSQDMLPVELAAVAPPPEPPASDTPLDVLPADMAAAAPVAEPLEAPPAAEPPPPEPAEPAARPPEVLPAAFGEGPSFDCRRARSRAELMVCADPVLAQADRRLGAAYQAALAAGVPDWRLERQQRRWLRAREDAALATPRAVAEVYEARIAELSAQAGAPDWPPSW